MNGNNIDAVYENTVEAMIKYAASAAADRLFDEAEGSIDDKDIIFSENNNRIIKEIINRERQSIYLTKRRKINRHLLISVIAAAVLILAFAAAAAAYKSGKFAMHTETTQVGTNIYIEELESGGASYDLGYSFKTSIKYIPAGFEEESCYQDENQFYAKYKYEESDSSKIGYSYFEITKRAASEGKFAVDSEDNGPVKIYINGCEAIFSISEDYKSIHWIMGDYLYEVSGNIDENELIKISENIS